MVSASPGPLPKAYAGKHLIGGGGGSLHYLMLLQRSPGKGESDPSSRNLYVKEPRCLRTCRVGREEEKTAFY